jgi:hypothetical protein
MATMMKIRQSLVSGVLDWCPLQTALSYGLKGEVAEPGPTPVQLFFGTIFGIAYALAYQHKLETGQDMPLHDVMECGVRHWHNRTVMEGEQPIISIDWGSLSEREHLGMLQRCIEGYYQTYTRTEPAGVEVEGSIELETAHGRATITTALDLITTNGWIIDLKTAAATIGKNGAVWLSGWREGDATWKPQAFIHLAIFGAMPYAFHVVGKVQSGKAPVSVFKVIHSKEHVDRWVELVLKPAIEQIQAGIFPAKPGGYCRSCQYRYRQCGVFHE